MIYSDQDNEINKRFGHFIRDARLKKGLTQDECAAYLGLSQSYYAYLERAHRRASLELAMYICRKLDTDMTDFIKSLNQSHILDNMGKTEPHP